MNIDNFHINENLTLFHLSCGMGWFERVGHELTINGKYKFAITSSSPGSIRVSEVETGMLLEEILIGGIFIDFDSKEKLIEFIQTDIVPIISKKIKEAGNFQKNIARQKQAVETLIGKKPKSIEFESIEEVEKYIEKKKQQN